MLFVFSSGLHSTPVTIPRIVPGLRRSDPQRSCRIPSRFSKVTFVAIKASIVLALFSVGCSNQATPQKSETMLQPPVPKPLLRLGATSRLFEMVRSGARKMPKSLQSQIDTAWNLREQDYIPRTGHLNSERLLGTPITL